MAEARCAGGRSFEWDPLSTYVKRPVPQRDQTCSRTRGGDPGSSCAGDTSGTASPTDHISPAGSIRTDSPAGLYLAKHGIAPEFFNSYGSRRGNHEVMVRGTFANVRLRNRLAPGTEGGFTTYLPSGEVMPIYDAAMLDQRDDVPLLVIAGKEYGSGSSRDWAAKGPLLGIRAVLAESFERIHRSNLIGMGICPFNSGLENPRSHTASRGTRHSTSRESTTNSRAGLPMDTM